MSNNPSIGILSIATNKYRKYWITMVESAAMNLPNKSTITFHLFTDDINECKKAIGKFQSFQFKFYSIPSFGWPEATLLRYKIYSESVEHFNETILMHLDADMLIQGDFSAIFNEKNFFDGIGLVMHPGYFRPDGRKLLKLYMRQPRLLVRDIRTKIIHGALGSWESNKSSEAFVPKRARRIYFCGGVWFGFNQAFKELVTSLNVQVENDSISGIMAIWHDESHLNAWATTNPHTNFPPSLCFDETYENLSGLPNIITAVDKGI